MIASYSHTGPWDIVLYYCTSEIKKSPVAKEVEISGWFVSFQSSQLSRTQKSITLLYAQCEHMCKPIYH